MKPSRWTAFFFAAPATLHLLVFALLPIGFALWLSFYDWDLLRENRPWVGLQNYADAAGDASFWNSMWNSARYAIVGVPLGMAVALGVAVLVHQKLRGVAWFRTIYYLPAISSGVAISMLWIYVYLPESGLINTFLKSLGFSGKTDFLNEVPYAMWALVFMSVWTGLGPRMVIFLAGLAGIDPHLYEAAEIDGATRWKTFWKVTLPMLAPTMLFVLVTSTISAFHLFTPIYMMTKGGPMDSTDVIGYHIYVEAWKRFNIGSASAQSFILLIVIGTIAWAQFRLMRGQLEAARA